MTRFDFNSDSWIVRVEYESDTKEMSIHTKSKIYTLVGVPMTVYEAFSSATSKGKFFNDSLKNKYVDSTFKP